MSRRHFLKMLGFGVVAGPGAADQLRAELQQVGVYKARLPPAAPSLAEVPVSLQGFASPTEDDDYTFRVAKARLRKVALPEYRDTVAEQVEITGMDVDLASHRSMSMSAKLRVQRRREVDRRLAHERVHAERTLSGFWKWLHGADE